MTSLSDHERSSTILSAEIGVAPRTTEEAGVDRKRASHVGAVVAAAICVAIAALGWQLAPEGWVLGIAGLPATTYLAWRMGPGVAAATGRNAVNRAVVLSAATIVLSDALVILVLIGWVVVDSVDSISIDGGASAIAALVGGLAFGVLAFLIGGIVVGVPVVVVVFPAALVWAAVVRRLVRRPA